MRRPLVAGMAALAIALTGCAPGASARASGSDPALVAARKVAGIADCPASTDEAALPDGLPDLSLDCLGGDSQVRLAGLRGRPLVLNLWAQWCAPCRAEARYLAEYSRKPEDGVQLLGINYDDPQPALALEFAQLVGWTYPQLADPQKSSATPLRVPGIPLTLLVDADGRVAARHSGPFSSTADLAGWVASGLEDR